MVAQNTNETPTNDCTRPEPVLLGQLLVDWSPDDPPVADKAPMPIAWTKSYTGSPIQFRKLRIRELP